MKTTYLQKKLNMKNSEKVFLGGTCNGSMWRDDLIEKLNVPYFNPVVDNWDEKAQKEEDYQRKNALFVLFVITPLMTGVFSIAEVVDCSNKRPESTLFCILKKDSKKEFDEFQLKSLIQVEKMVKSNGAKTFSSLQDVANFLNGQEYKKRIKKLAGL